VRFPPAAGATSDSAVSGAATGAAICCWFPVCVCSWFPAAICACFPVCVCVCGWFHGAVGGTGACACACACACPCGCGGFATVSGTGGADADENRFVSFACHDSLLSADELNQSKNPPPLVFLRKLRCLLDIALFMCLVRMCCLLFII